MCAVGGPRVRDLDLDRIAEAGLAIADALGPSGVTMRAVAERLDVTPMALYRHVENKAGLVALVVERGISELPLPTVTGRGWRDDLWELAAWMRERHLAHPAVVPLRATYEVWSPAIVAVGERWVQVWQQSGLPEADANRAAIVSAMAVLGVIEQETGPEPFDPPGDLELLAGQARLRAVLAAPPRDRTDFELLVRSLVDGLHARLAGASP
jgi:AcrR family transcriptional regulator